MFKILKWDVLDFLKRYGYTLLSVPLVFLLALIPLGKHSVIALYLITLASGLGAITGLYLIILAGFVCINWLVGRQIQLHFSLPVPSWKLLLSKLLLAGALNTFTCLWGLQLMLVFGSYNSGILRWISFQNLNGIAEIILFLTLIDAALMFSVILAKSISWARIRQQSFTWIFSTVICGSLILLDLGVLLLVSANPADLVNIRQLNMTANRLQVVYPYWLSLQGVCLLALFWGSHFMVKHMLNQD